MTCVKCRLEATIDDESGTQSYAYYRRESSDRWAYHGGVDLNAPRTYPYLIALVDGKPVQIPNPEYAPAEKPLNLELWLCPSCENGVQRDLFRTIMEAARRKLQSSSVGLEAERDDA